MATTSTPTREGAVAAPVLPPRTRRGPVIVAVGDVEARHLLEAARVVAGRLDTGVRVVSVVPPLMIPDLAGGVAYLPATADAERELQAGVAQLVQREIRDVVGDAPHWDWEVATGDPAPVLRNIASDLDAALVLMGLGRHRAIDRLLAAETTLRVVRHTTAPVLAIGERFDALPRNVVVATDFSPRSALAAEAVLPLLGEGASLHVVHAWERTGSHSPAVLDVERRYEQGIPAQFTRFLSALAIPAGVTVTTDVLEGKIAARLLDYADSSRADLVVAGRQGLNFLARLTVGSVTTTLVRAAACALLIVPEPTFADLDRMRRRLTGTSESDDPARWPEQLDAFTRRNAGRRADLEVDDPELGAQSQERGYAFIGASYDPHDRRVELMLGGSTAGAAHLGRGITSADGIAVLCDPQGRDIVLCIRHGQGQTLLLFGPDA
jgi:nucleotide-binding universal stress UspA family protein